MRFEARRRRANRTGTLATRRAFAICACCCTVFLVVILEFFAFAPPQKISSLASPQDGIRQKLHSRLGAPRRGDDGASFLRVPPPPPPPPPPSTSVPPPPPAATSMASFWPPPGPGVPDLVGLVTRLGAALEPFQNAYRSKIAAGRGLGPEPCDRGFGEAVSDTFLGGCPRVGCESRSTLQAAKELCVSLDDCGGVTRVSEGSFEVRTSGDPQSSSDGEISWVRKRCSERATASRVWNAFHNAMLESLDDPELNLDAPLPAVREDDSIFLSVSSYRDPSCGPTVRRAFERADHPNILHVGVVQQNCMEESSCMTGTGWANTRRWVPQPHPDPDCLTDFCASPLGRPHCDAGRVRILRIEEGEAFGPFFSRYLNAKMWRGENYYLQVDSHTDFRNGWDSTLTEMAKLTPSYPKFVISNYPPSGTPDTNRGWARAESTAAPRPPSALCGCTFEGAGAGHQTVRLSQTGRTFASGIDAAIPRHSAFIAAGFFFAHSSFVEEVPFDPFLPYIFMGEEIALSIRFWTSGFDIYAPSVDVLAHEYVRKEHPKFWETVTMVFSNGGIHNALTNVIIPRIQHLVGFPEAKFASQVSPANLLTMMDSYQIGNVRTADEFSKVMGLDLDGKQQHAPKWCRDGQIPPWFHH